MLVVFNVFCLLYIINALVKATFFACKDVKILTHVSCNQIWMSRRYNMKVLQTASILKFSEICTVVKRLRMRGLFEPTTILKRLRNSIFSGLVHKVENKVKKIMRGKTRKTFF